MAKEIVNQCTHWKELYLLESDKFQEAYHQLLLHDHKLEKELKQSNEYGEVMRNRSIMEAEKSKALTERIDYLLSLLRMTHDKEISLLKGMPI